jgi:hypothetical protein
MMSIFPRRLILFFCLLAAQWLLAPSAPAAQPTQWAARGPGGGGSFFSPSFSPYLPGELYVASDMSDVFHSTNYGAAWCVVSFQQLMGGRQALVQFTSNPLVRYGLDYSGDATTPTKSVDGGMTWQHLAGDPTGGGAFALYADPNSTNRLLVSDYSNLYFSSDGGDTFATEFTYGNGCYLAGAFFDASNIYVATLVGLLVSTNNGASFALAAVGGINTTNEALFSFAGAKQNGVTRFFCTTMHPGDVFPGMDVEQVYYSFINVYALTWGQPNWLAATNGISSQDDPVFVAMALNDTSTVYLAGQQNSNTEYPAIYKTANGGASWQLSLLVTNNQNAFTGWAGYQGDSGWGYGAGAMGLAVAPNDSTKAAYSDMGFVHVTTNGGAFWKQAYVSPADENPANASTPKGKAYHSVGLEPTSCWGVAWADSNHVVAAYTDIKGAISADGGNSWSFGYTGDTYNTMYSCVKHPVTGVLYAGTSSVHDMYQSTHLTDSSINGAVGAVLFSTNQGVTWLTMTNLGYPVIWVELDPANTNRLFATLINTNANVGGIYVSTNIQKGAAASWQHLAVPPRTQGHPFNIHALMDGTLVCTYSGRRAGSSLAFTASSGVFVSTNAGSAWIDRSDPNMEYWTMDLLVDPADLAQNTWYACVYSGWGGPPNNMGGLYRTTNRGVSWTRLISDNGVSSCTLNPMNTNELYVTTETDGLLFSGNIRSATPTLTTVASYPFAQPERVFFNPYNPSEIWVTSFGNGIQVGSTRPLPGALAVTAPRGGSPQITLQQGSPGSVYSFFESTNLVTWTLLGTNSADTNGTARFTDTNPATSRRFYRSLTY